MAEKNQQGEEFAGAAGLSGVPVRTVLPGMHVELTGTPTAVILRSRTGRVVREDEDEDYVIVALDVPAQYRHASGEVEDLSEIAVLTDNLRILGR